MSGILGRFQVRDFQYWKGMTQDNHLGALLQRKPQMATNLMVKLLAFHTSNTLNTLLEGLGVREFEDDSEYYWEVVGNASRNIPLLYAAKLDGTIVSANSGNIGANLEPFYLVFAEDWFADGEFIVGNLNEVYQFRILGDAIPVGTNYQYKVELAGGNTTGVPAERLLAGERFSIEAAFVEASLSRKVGDVRYAAPVAMRNEWSTVRIQHKVPGNMLKKKLAIGIPVQEQTSAGKVVKKIEPMWMFHVDYAVECQFSKYINNALAFGRSNRTADGQYLNIGKSGNAIRTGSGLYEQMEVANTFYYNVFSLEMLENALYELSVAKLSFGDRYFVLRTGEQGAKLFHRAVMQEVNGWQSLNVSDAGIQKTSSPMHSNSLKAGFQFTEWLAPMGIHLKVEVDPHYDDPERNKIRDANGYLASSRRFDIMDMGSSDEPNIFKCRIKGQPEFRGYQWGPFANPFTGETNNSSASYDEDSSVIHKKAQFGICVLDPTRTMSLIPIELQGA